jgi:BirA family biotin operon repressor/biotin-[acetyl-CoA-carboxylase] ligase
MQATRRRVLDALADGPVTGPELADSLDVSRAAVWKHVEALREAGFEVASDDAGYVLDAVPEFGAEAVEFGLDAPFEVEYHDTIDSTNRRARELATEGAGDVVVLADEQTGGKGRLDRAWSSPSGGIWLSLVLRPEVPAAHVPAFTLATAVAVTRAAREVGVDARIKWPNDVVVGDDEKKLAGILTETQGEADRVSWVVVGVGINANVDVATLPAERGVTSIREEVGDVDRRVFTQRLLEAFDELREDLPAAVEEWTEYASTLGKRVRVETPGETVEGEAVDVEYPGALVVDTGDERVTVTAGDCEHLRPV